MPRAKAKPPTKAIVEVLGHAKPVACAHVPKASHDNAVEDEGKQFEVTCNAGAGTKLAAAARLVGILKEGELGALSCLRLGTTRTVDDGVGELSLSNK